MQEYWLAISREIGRMFGSVAAVVIELLLYILIAYLFWGLIWDRIITKAGYKGKAFRWRFLMMMAPLLIPIAKDQSLETQQSFGLVLSMIFYAGLVSLALLPWPNNQKTAPNKTEKSNP